jgi:hypothetical protein
MAWFRKKTDPISDRSRTLNEEIAALEAEIKTLDSQLQRQNSLPRLRSTAIPQNGALNHASPTGAAVPARSPTHEPIFEDVAPDRLKVHAETLTTPDHYNELGVRKYDLPALLQRIRNHFRGPSTTNPKLVSYLAAGGIQGLRPLRYEKRVARNRFILLVAFLFVVLLGLFAVFVRGRR